MTTTDLKKYINEKEKIPFILEKCGCNKITQNDTGGYKNISATQPDGDNPKGVVIDCTDYLGYCSYSRGVKFEEKKDLIDFVQASRKIDFISAVKWLHTVLGLPYTYTKKKTVTPISKKDEIINIFKQYKEHRTICDVRDVKYINPAEFRDFSKTIHQDLFSEGIIKKTIDKFGLMYDYQHHRTCFVHRDWLTGEIVGMNGRTSIQNYDLIGIPKYFLTKNYNKTRQLYGLWENRSEIEKANHVTVFESEKSVLKRDSRNDSTGVALSGKTISTEQSRLLLGLNVYEIIIALDNDVDIYDVFANCENFYNLRSVSFIKDKHGYLGKKDSPADADNKIYKKLFAERITYTEAMHKKYLEHIKKERKDNVCD